MFSSMRTYYRHKQLFENKALKKLRTKKKKNKKNRSKTHNPQMPDLPTETLDSIPFLIQEPDMSNLVLGEESNESDTSNPISDNVCIRTELHRKPQTLREAVAKAAILTKIPRTSVNLWLYFLSPFGDLPRNYKTLLKTSRDVEVKEIEGSNWYQPSASIEIILALEKTNVESITLDFHIDGLPIASKELWPVTCFLRELNKPVLLTTFEGNKKPNRKMLLEDICKEVQDMVVAGLPVEDRIVTVKVGNFLCDSPARAYVLDIVAHNATFPCFRCWVSSWRKKCKRPRARKTKNRPSMQIGVFPKRTDDEFRRKVQFSKNTAESHHRSPEKVEVEMLGIDVIKSFPVDYMHVVLLGITRHQLIAVWEAYISNFIEDINNYLLKIRDYIPDEFPRKCRVLRDDWKATEYRLFLLYIGPVVLKDILNTDQYVHFLKLCISIRIMCSEEHIKHEGKLEMAERFIHEFVEEYENIYSSEPVSYTMHMATHLADCVRQQKMTLDKFSTFNGENFLQILKNSYDRGPNPLKQIIKRFGEVQNFQEDEILQKNDIRLDQNIKDTNQYKKCHIKGLTIGVDVKNSFIKAKEFVITVQSIEYRENTVVFKGFPCHKIEDTFVCPVQSRKFGIFSCEIDRSHSIEFTDKEITHKFLCIPKSNRFDLIELLHGKTNNFK